MLKTNGEKTEKSIDKPQDVSKKIKNFNELRKSYDLIEENFTTRMILRKIGEELEEYIKILIQVLQPEEYHSLHEGNFFDDAEKAKVFELYKNLMITHREALKAEILNEEKNNIATINYLDKEIKRVRPEILRIIQKMQDAWKKEQSQGNVRYFG
jgi:hypothetical protein